MSAHHRFNNDLRYRDGSHPNQRQLTPAYVLRPAVLDLGADEWLDPCTEPDNPTGATRFFTADDDGLAQRWPELPAFVNPPYSKAKEPWVEKCIAHGEHHATVLLIPSHTDTRIFHRAMQSAEAVVFIKGRVKFGVLRANGRQEAASHPSCLIGWSTNLEHCAPLGRRVTLAGAA
jgi:hypothetical protein